MESNLLIAAKKYDKERKWEKAIENLEQVINQTEGNPDAEVYILYAKSLRRLSNTDQANLILTKGLIQYPENEGILREFLKLYDSLGDWQSAEPIALSLIKINSEHANYHFHLGRIYSFLRDFQKAEDAYRNGLRHRHQISFEKLIEKVQSGFSDDPTDVSSHYVFIEGRNNLGAFIHQYGDRKFFTKISRLGRSSKREEIFYKNISSDFPKLKEIVPLYIDSKVIDKIMYLTIEMIDDDIPLKLDHTNEIITKAIQISDIRYSDLIKEYPNPDYLFQFKNRPISVIIFFTQIHKKHYNDRLFSSFYKHIEQNNYSNSINNAIKKLESLIMDNKLYLFIRPEEHYSLLHADLIRANIKIKRINETPIIFDWGTFTIGPRFIDIARYLSSRFIPYSKMKELYLLNNERGGKLSLIEKIFFLYAMALLYILSTSNKTIDEKLSDFILPAINDMEVLISQFKDNNFGQIVESLSIEKKELQLQNKKLNKNIHSLEKESQLQKKKLNNNIQSLKKENQLQKKELDKRIQLLEKEKQNTQKKFSDILNSKSWKLTAPLRRFIVLIKNDKQN